LSKIIVITGAGAGLGRALAQRFAADGDTVILLGRTLSKVQAVASELGGPAMAVECDVASPDSVRKAFAEVAERHPKIDVLINNAAVYEPFSVVDATDEQILQPIAINLAGPIFCTRSAVPMMEPGAHIIYVSSESVDEPFAMLSLYQSSKAGLERFSHFMESELEANGIRVTMIRAGQMMTDPKEWTRSAAAMQFHQQCLAKGLDLMKRPISQAESVPGIFRAVIDMPPDLHVATVTLHARKG
jgi:NAD(P)-dependent dehydrogenase (short-subunit alcohol dehydrogenase family)